VERNAQESYFKLRGVKMEIPSWIKKLSNDTKLPLKKKGEEPFDEKKVQQLIKDQIEKVRGYFRVWPSSLRLDLWENSIRSLLISFRRRGKFDATDAELEAVTKGIAKRFSKQGSLDKQAEQPLSQAQQNELEIVKEYVNKWKESGMSRSEIAIALPKHVTLLDREDIDVLLDRLWPEGQELEE